MNPYISCLVVTFGVYTLQRTLKFLFRLWKINKAVRPFSLKEKYSWPAGHLAAFKTGFNHDVLMHHIRWTREQPRMFTFYNSSFKPVLMLVHPETAKVLLKSPEPKPRSLGTAYNMILPWLGDGLLIAEGKKWARNRRLLTPAFHFNILKTHVDVHNRCSEILMNKCDNDGESIDISHLVDSCTLDIITKCAFSLERSIQISDEYEYLKTTDQIKNLVIQRVFNPLLYFNSLYYLTHNGKLFKQLVEKSHRNATDIINKRKVKLLNSEGLHKNINPEKCMDFLDIILLARDEDGVGLTDQEILDEVETFLFEGHDTVSSGISWAIYNFATHPEYQHKAQKELDSVLINPPLIQWDDLANLPYLTMCIKESLRMYPPVPFHARKLVSPVMIDKEVIPEGALISIAVWNIHHNPQIWGEDHMTYSPDRFSPENITSMDPFAFVPFSGGPRNCIGQSFAMNEMKVVLGRILSCYTVTADEKHQVRMLPEIVLKTETGIKIKFTKR